MHLKKILIVLLFFLFVSCEGVMEQRTELNNIADQKRVDKLYKSTSKDNYAKHISDITRIYTNRLTTIGLDAGNSKYIFEEVFKVWPRDYSINSKQFIKKISSNSPPLISKVNSLKAQGKSTSALKILLESEKADTVFSKVEKQYLKEAHQIFDLHNQPSAYYVSKLDLLEEKYENSYSLTNKEYSTITVFSRSIGTFIQVLNQSKKQLSSLAKFYKTNQAGTLSSAFLLFQQGGDDDAAEHYTGPDGGFMPDWGGIGGNAVLDATGGALIVVTTLGVTTWYWGPPGWAITLAGMGMSTVGGGLWGGGGELVRQFDAHVDFLKEIEEANEL